MKRIILVALVALAGASGSLLAGEQERIGVYDSRAIAIAWAGTEPFREELGDLRQRHGAAREAGDTELADKLAAEGQAMQAKLHRQGFSTAPVDDILAHFEAEIAAVLKATGVTVIVSKWDTEGLAGHPEAEQVDVTMELAQAMGTNEQQLGYIRQIGDQKPIPLEELEKQLAAGHE